MSEKFSKWLVNGVSPTYKWDILGLSFDPNHLLTTMDLRWSFGYVWVVYFPL